VASLRYTYRLRPSATAERVLLAEWGRCRWLWNECVHQQRTGKRPNLTKLGVLLTQARAQLPWLREGSQDAQGQLVHKYAQSLNASFRVPGCRRPGPIRSKGSLPRLAYKNGYSLRNDRLCLNKCPPIPVVWHRPLPGPPKTLAVYRDSLGHWYASFIVRIEEDALDAVGHGVGIDWGVRVTATASDPAYDLPYAGHAKRAAGELAKYQRRMARRAPGPGRAGSKGYRQAKLQTARLHKKVARQRQHDARQWARRVVADHDLIAVEDFRPKFLTRSRMARKASDAGIGIAKSTLVEYGKRAGRKVVLVPPAYTTMTCSECGTRTKERLGLAERIFACSDCGLIADRDRNAARAILAQAERILAGADDVRHAVDPLAGLPCAV
jgi:putative transposase